MTPIPRFLFTLLMTTPATLSMMLGMAPSRGIASPVGAQTTAAHAVAEPPRLDVRSVCPKIDQELRQSLTRAWTRVEMPTVVRVQFKLKGQRVTDVVPLSGRVGYYRYVRQAVSGLTCDARADSDVEHVFVFNIRFVEPPDEPARDGVAGTMNGAPALVITDATGS